MRFNVAAAVLAVVATAGAKALTKRQEVSASNPAACVSATAPIVGSLDILACAADTTCSSTTTTTTSILGEAVTFTAGVCE
ncbi:hypothetical protein BC629DRAFT_1589478 [Irpex lacteus]|nr:hypothetical protein BC629DRAFT_1589478 [Irpex lacteus]